MICLDDYLDQVAAEPWAWGRMDCAFFASNWVAAATQRDPLGPYRGTYDTAAGAARLIASCGGLVGLVDSVMVRCGFMRCDDPEHGDIGIVPVPGEGEQAVARASTVIRSGPWWVGRALNGVVYFRGNAAAAWRVL